MSNENLFFLFLETGSKKLLTVLGFFLYCVVLCPYRQMTVSGSRRGMLKPVSMCKLSKF